MRISDYTFKDEYCFKCGKKLIPLYTDINDYNTKNGEKNYFIKIGCLRSFLTPFGDSLHKTYEIKEDENGELLTKEKVNKFKEDYKNNKKEKKIKTRIHKLKLKPMTKLFWILLGSVILWNLSKYIPQIIEKFIN